MHPLTNISIVLMDIRTKDKGDRFGAAVTIPGRNTETHTLREWDEIVKAGDSIYDGLDLAISEALEKHLGKAPAQMKGADAATRLVELVLRDDTVLFADDRGEPYARVRSDDHFDILPIDKSFSKWLGRMFYQAEGKAPGQDALKSAINILQGRAIYDGESHKLHIRVADHESAYWYYLSDDRRRAVRISRDGWEVVDEPPILFRHYTHMRPQDEPERQERPGALDKLLDLFNFRENDRRMFKIMLITDLVPGIAHCGLSLSGQQGCGKTLVLKMEKQLIDPSSIEILSFPKKDEEFLRLLDRHYIVPFDNITRVSWERSDMLCRSISGESSATRKLYTDDEDYIRAIKRIIRMNGLNNNIRASDLLSRMILMELTPIGEMRGEKALWEDFYRLRPDALGELFDLLSKTMDIYENITSSKAPRMADWYEWAEAAAVALGMQQHEFTELFAEYEEKQDSEALEQSSLAPILEGFARDGEKAYVGTAADLLKILTLRADEQGISIRDRRQWPSNHVELGKRITPLVPNLASRGVIVTRGLKYRDLGKVRPDLLTKSLEGRGYGPRDRMIIIEFEASEQDGRQAGN